MIVYAVRYGNYEPSEVLALYDNYPAALQHADSGEWLEVVPMTVKSRFEKKEHEHA